MKKVAMTIAGSDPTGGAGILADMSVFEAMGARGVGVISALTAQNEKRVADIIPVDPGFVTLQIETLFETVTADAVKTGMLSSRETIEAVAGAIAKHKMQNFVIDPVMKASSGADLLEPNALDTLKDKLFPLAYLITPNIPEAEALIGAKITDINSMKEAATKLIALGPKNVVITGGHLEGERLVDLLLVDGKFSEFAHDRINTNDSHGTGCVFSAGITALLARGESMEKAIGEAGKFVVKKLKAGSYR